MRRNTMLMLLALLLIIIPGAEAKFTSLLDAYENCSELELELKDLEYLRRDALKEFLQTHLGPVYVQQNESYISSVVLKSNTDRLVDKMLETKISNKKDRSRVLKTMSLPDTSLTRLNQLGLGLKNLVERLRRPDGNGNEYAHYSRESHRSLDKKKLIAKHAIGSWQTYENTFADKVFKIRIYSPTKLDLFSMNRDVFLDRLVVKYWVEQKEEVMEKVYNRLLKRGESLEFHLPVIADKVTIKLTYATKPEHRNKAVFYVETVAADLVDKPDSPFIGLIATIENDKYKKGGISDKQAALKLLKSQLRQGIEQIAGQASVRQLPAIVKDDTADLPTGDYASQYFSYMLKDKNVTRQQLIKKFNELFVQKAR